MCGMLADGRLFQAGGLLARHLQLTFACHMSEENESVVWMRFVAVEVKTIDMESANEEEGWIEPVHRVSRSDRGLLERKMDVCACHTDRNTYLQVIWPSRP